MSLPVYFVHSHLPEPGPAHFAACGWYCASDGTLHEPEYAGNADALVFDDRFPLPGRAEDLVASLLRCAEARASGRIILDFERPVGDEAMELIRQLSERIQTAAPHRFCTAGGCEPIFCYDPSRQTFADFRAQAGQWLELRPIKQTVHYPAQDAAPDDAQSDSFFSEVLQCHYRAKTGEGELILELFDTPESFLDRTKLLSGRFHTAVGLWNELNAYGIGNDIA